MIHFDLLSIILYNYLQFPSSKFRYLVSTFCIYCASAYTYMQTKISNLDIGGRPVVVLQKSTVVPEHNQNFQVFLLPQVLMNSHS